jgi:hypothetical protein
MTADEADGSFTVWSVSIAPGEKRPVEPREWDDALVLIRSGDVDVQCDLGARHTFHAGDMVALCWLRALNLANVGAERVELLAVRRSVR